MSAGLNQFLSVPVPLANGDGALLDVSTTDAEKTFYLSGDFRGIYSIMGTHDDVLFVPILFFSSGQGPRTIRRDIVATLKSIFVRRAALGDVVINMGGQTVCIC
jgi:hypothetical protein